MAGDYTRFRFNPLNDASRLLQQQGRVMLDQDWNELVEIIDRRWRAETVDIIGTGVVPMQTPHGFEIKVVGSNDLSIGQGRIYVDGLLAENHGTVPQFDPVLKETPGTQPLAFASQPYIPKAWPFGGTNPFAIPTGAGPHLVYLDVWKREVTYLQAGDLVDKAVGLDTTTRLADGVASQGAAEHSRGLDLRQFAQRLGQDHGALGRAAHHSGGRCAQEHRSLHHSTQHRLPRQRKPHLSR